MAADWLCGLRPQLGRGICKSFCGIQESFVKRTKNGAELILLLDCYGGCTAFSNLCFYRSDALPRDDYAETLAVVMGTGLLTFFFF